MLTTAVLEDALGVALNAADAAAQVIARHYRGVFAVDFKSDESPVTVADREAEAVIKQVLKAQYPDHAFYGENA